MPKQASQKPETTYRTAKPKDAVYRISDGQGFYMQISPDGEKRWRFQYTRPTGGRNTLGLGDYPSVALVTARERRDEARRLLAEGIDPGEHRKITKAMQKNRAANSFEFVALEWYAKFSVNWVDAHGERIIRRLEREVFPWLGGRPIAEITAPELLAVLRRIEDRGALETADRTLKTAGRFSAMASPPAGRNGTPPKTCGAHCHPPGRHTLRPLPNLRPSARYCGPWTPTREPSSRSAPFAWLPWFLSGPENCGKRNGRKSTWTRPPGKSRRAG